MLCLEKVGIERGVMGTITCTGISAVFGSVGEGMSGNGLEL